jgi:hypothetical protein
LAKIPKKEEQATMDPQSAVPLVQPVYRAMQDRKAACKALENRIWPVIAGPLIETRKMPRGRRKQQGQKGHD